MCSSIRMSRPPESAIESFSSRRRTAGVAFVVGDAVEVSDGAHAGRRAAVISLEGLVPDVTFLIEFGDDGTDAIVAQAALRFVSESSP